MSILPPAGIGKVRPFGAELDHPVVVPGFKCVRESESPRPVAEGEPSTDSRRDHGIRRTLSSIVESCQPNSPGDHSDLESVCTLRHRGTLFLCSNRVQRASDGRQNPEVVRYHELDSRINDPARISASSTEDSELEYQLR